MKIATWLIVSSEGLFGDACLDFGELQELAQIPARDDHARSWLTRLTRASTLAARYCLYFMLLNIHISHILLILGMGPLL